MLFITMTEHVSVGILLIIWSVIMFAVVLHKIAGTEKNP